jgi:hypothetical protein
MNNVTWLIKVVSLLLWFFLIFNNLRFFFSLFFFNIYCIFLEGKNLYMKKLRTFDDYIISLSFQPKIYSRKERTRRIGKNYT